jgi:predicted HNH restriction endonuclease
MTRIVALALVIVAVYNYGNNAKQFIQSHIQQPIANVLKMK